MTACPHCLPPEYANSTGPVFMARSGSDMLDHLEAEHGWLFRSADLVCGTCWYPTRSNTCKHYNGYGQAVSA